MLTAALTSTLLAAEEQLAPVFAPAPIIAIIAGCTFTILGFVVFSYKNVAHRNPSNASAPHETAIDEFGHAKDQ